MADSERTESGRSDGAEVSNVDRNLDRDGERNPPLPRPVPSPFPHPRPQQPSRKSRNMPKDANGSDDITYNGCWLLQITPVLSADLRRRASGYYRGTMRVSAAGDRTGQVYISGDLYAFSSVAPKGKVIQPRQIPIFARNAYRYYFVSKPFRRNENTRFIWDVYKFNARARRWEEPIEIEVRLPSDPDQWNDDSDDDSESKPSDNTKSEDNYGVFIDNYRRGEIKIVKVHRNSTLMRRARVDVDRVGRVSLPSRLVLPSEDVTKDRIKGDGGEKGRTKGADTGEDRLKEIFARVGWAITIDEGDDCDKDRAPAEWTDKLLHEYMLRRRGISHLDDEWRYHLLAVDAFKPAAVLDFGRMYDRGAIDSNLVPREGVAIAAGSRFPNHGDYGGAAGLRLEAVPEAYLRTVIHELGHAMGLTHRSFGRTIMQGLQELAQELALLRTPVEFLEEIKKPLTFAPEDALHLGHAPDNVVRPGGLPFGFGFKPSAFPIEDLVHDANGRFELLVSPLRLVLPLGAPLRLHLRLSNRTSAPLAGPKALGLSDGFVSGRVIGPEGTARVFLTAKVIEGQQLDEVDPSKPIFDALTLLRGTDGPLLPSPGRYVVEVNAIWTNEGHLLGVSGRTTVLVIPPPDDAEARIALTVLDAPEIMVPLLFRTNPEHIDHALSRFVRGGLQVLRMALHSPVLRPHYGVVEAKRHAEEARPRLDRAAVWIRDDTLMTYHEASQLLDLAERVHGPARPDVARMIAILRLRKKELARQGFGPWP